MAAGRPVEVILGSASPARLSVLRGAGLDPRVVVSEVDETAILDDLAGTPPEDVVLRLAQAKSDAVVAALLDERTGSGDAAGHTGLVVLTCDSMLLFDGALTGKPHTPDIAADQWRRVRGRSAELLTGHVVTRIDGRQVTGSAVDTVSTAIDFADVSDAEIDAYVATGEPLWVAGGFTLDGLGGWFIDGVDGDPSSVLGIGLPTVRRLLARLGIAVTDLWRPPEN